MNKRIVLWRHGRTQWNVQGRVQGQTDVPLDDEGRRQARVAAPRLAELRPDRVVSSDLVRARSTAEALVQLTGVELEIDPRLREVSFGEREGMTVREAWERWPEEMRSTAENTGLRVPGSETYEEAGARVAVVLEELAASLEDGQTAVVVSHGASIRTGACTFVGLPQGYWQVFSGLSNCACVYLEERWAGPGRSWRIQEWNSWTPPEPVLSDDEADPGLGESRDVR